MTAYGRLMPTPDRAPSIAAAMVNPTSADIQWMQACAQRDLGLLSDREFARYEAFDHGFRPPGRDRWFWNPFTGECRKSRIESRPSSAEWQSRLIGG